MGEAKGERDVTKRGGGFGLPKGKGYVIKI